jgi:hypothetical protein
LAGFLAPPQVFPGTSVQQVLPSLGEAVFNPLSKKNPEKLSYQSSAISFSLACIFLACIERLRKLSSSTIELKADS